MIFYMKLAWRNIFRNKRRTIIASIAIGIGLASLIVMDAMMIGMEANMIKSTTASFLGEAQIHEKDFREEYDIQKTIVNSRAVEDRLNNNPFIERFSRRAMSLGTIKSAEDISPVTLFGIDPAAENEMSKIDEAISMGKGEYFYKNKETDIVIGTKLAEKLKVTIGDRIIVTVGSKKKSKLSETDNGSVETDMDEGDMDDMESGPVEEAFYVSGIYHFNIKEMDSGMAFIRLGKAQKMLNLGSGYHQIAVKFKQLNHATEAEMPFWNEIPGEGNEFVSWAVLLPQLKAVFDMTGISLFVTALILFAMITFGIINTLFMSLFERMFELGVLRAVGTRISGIRKLLILEAGALSALSIIFGTILGVIVTVILINTGIDYRGIEMAGTTISDLLYPVIRIHQFIIYPIGVFLFTLLVGLYPAFYAGKMSITKALRRSL